jgi:hypothetical protein
MQSLNKRLTIQKLIGIGEGLTTFALPHHRTYGSVYGDS